MVVMVSTGRRRRWREMVVVELGMRERLKQGKKRNFCFLYAISAFCISVLFNCLLCILVPVCLFFFSERKAPLFIAMDDHQVSFMCSDFRFSASNIFLFFSFCSSRCSCLVFFPCSTCFCFFLFLVPGFVFFLFARMVPLSFFICQISRLVVFVLWS